MWLDGPCDFSIEASDFGLVSPRLGRPAGRSVASKRPKPQTRRPQEVAKKMQEAGQRMALPEVKELPRMSSPFYILCFFGVPFVFH